MNNFHFRNMAPGFIKRWVWNRKSFNADTNVDRCPVDFVEFLIASLDPNDSLLDFGCGPGNLLLALRARGWGGHYIGVDVSDRAIELGKKIGDKNAEWHVSLIEDFPVGDVNAVCFVESLYYARSVTETLARWSHANTYVRIVHADRHFDVLVQMEGFRRDGTGPIWYREPFQTKAVRS